MIRSISNARYVSCIACIDSKRKISFLLTAYLTYLRAAEWQWCYHTEAHRRKYRPPAGTRWRAVHGRRYIELERLVFQAISHEVCAASWHSGTRRIATSCRLSASCHFCAVKCTTVYILAESVPALTSLWRNVDIDSITARILVALSYNARTTGKWHYLGNPQWSVYSIGILLWNKQDCTKWHHYQKHYWL